MLEVIGSKWAVSPWPTVFLLGLLLLCTIAVRLAPRARLSVLLPASLAVYAWYGPTTIVATAYLLAVGYLGLRSRSGRGPYVALLLLPIVAGNVAELAGLAAVGAIALQPMGTSYLALELIGHIVDEKTKAAPKTGLVGYLTGHTLFCKAVAGPIARARHVLRPAEPPPELGPAVLQVLYGALLKWVVSDNLWAPFADADPSRGFVPAWLFAFAYTSRLYLDFCGYSHMAIGAGRMLGYSLPENFKRPFFATSVSEFWRRWHMSLSFWLRDYFFVRVARRRWLKPLQQSLLATFLTLVLVGAWHGFAPGFLLWGALHGGAMVLERTWIARAWPIPPQAVRRALTCAFLVFAFLPFARPESAGMASLAAAFGARGAGDVSAILLEAAFVLVAAVLIDHAGHAWIERPAVWSLIPLEARVAFGVVSFVLVWALGFSGAVFLYARF